jgi:hypothetical protein
MIIHSLRQEYVSKQGQLQWSRYKYSMIQLHCTGTGKGTQYKGTGKGTLFRYNVQVQVHVHCKGTVVEGYKYNKHVQVKVHCSGTPYRYTIQLNYKGTGKVATGTGTQYRYWYTAHLKIHC